MFDPDIMSKNFPDSINRKLDELIMEELQFPAYAAPKPNDLMRIVKKAMKGKIVGRLKKMPKMRKLLADPPGCRLHMSPDVQIKPRKTKP